MKRKLFAFIIAFALIVVGPLNALIIVSAQALSSPVFLIEEISNDGETLVTSVIVESGSFSALNLQFELSGLECTAIEKGSVLKEAQLSEENPITVTDSTNINVVSAGKSNISFACTPEYESIGELYKITFNITSLKDYHFNINCLKCYQYSDGNYIKVTPTINSNVSYDKTIFDKTTLLRYSTSNGEVTIMGCDTIIFHKYEIPSEINGYPVKNIADNAFKNCCNMTEIAIPDGVETIGAGAFYNCTSLSKIKLPSTLTKIGQNAFYNTSYYNNSDNWENNFLYIDQTLIKAKASNIRYYNIKEGTILLADYAFSSCTNYLRGISFPQSVKYIGDYCFANCNALNYFCSQEEFFFDESVTELPIEPTTEAPTEPATEAPTEPATEAPTEPATEAPTEPATEAPTEPTTEAPTEHATEAPTEPTTEAMTESYSSRSVPQSNISKFPDSILSIGVGAFNNCISLKSIIMGQGLKAISKDAFNSCSSLEKVTINNNVLNIEDGAFAGCKALKEIFIPQNVSKIGYGVFLYCQSLNSISVSEYNNYYSSDDLGCLFNKSKTELIQYPIGSQNTSYYIPDTVKTIDDYAFCRCSNIESITVPKGVNLIGTKAFAECSALKLLTYNAEAASYRGGGSDSPFYNLSAIETVTIGEEVTSLPNYFLYYCSGITDVEIPESVSTIGNYAFAGCRGLTEITIPKAVTLIGTNTFYNCTALKSLSYNAVTASYSGGGSDSPFYNLSAIEKVTIGEEVTSLPNYFLYCCSGITDIEIPESVTTIGNYAFAGCRGLTEITIPKAVTLIGVRAFNSCNALKSLSYNAVAASYSGGGSNSPFCNLSSIENITIGEEVTSLPNYFLYCCSGFSNVEIPKSVTSIGSYAFYCCNNLCYAVIGSGLTTVGSYAFYDSGLNHVFFKGDETLKSSMSIDSYNSPLTNAVWHCNVLPNAELFSNVESFPATCTSQGYTTYCCAFCSTEFNGNYTPINPDGHNFIEGICEYCNKKQPIDILLNTFSIAEIINAGETIKFKFIPETSGPYYFYSDSKLDTYGYIYNSNQSALASNDDSGNGNNFCVSYSMTAGTVYYLGARFYSSGNTGSFAVAITNDYRAETAHDFEQTVNESSCINDEETVYKCKNCGYTYTVVTKESTGHNYVDGVCTECGWIEDLRYSISYGEVTITGYSGNKTELVIPSNLCGYPVVKIGNNAFEGCTGLTSITIPDSVTSIGSSAFRGCSSLTSVTIPDSVTSIGGSEFSGCSSLTSVTIPDSVTSIGSSAFRGCSSLTSVTIPDSVTSIGSSVFWGCSSLTSVTIPDSVTSIGYSVFEGCTGLISITVDENNEYYSSDEYGVLYNKDKTELIQYPIGNPREAFIISDSVTSIGNATFEGCTGLTSITIPDSVTSIGYSAFSGCTGLTSVNYTGTREDWCKIIFSASDSNPVCYSKCLYINGDPVGDVTVPDDLSEINAYSFYNCQNLTSIAIPDSVISIGSYAFSGCTGLTSITIPDSVTSISNSAFYYCSSLTSVTIPDSVTSIGDWTFGYCSNLTSITIPNSVTFIGDYAFDGCTGLTDITIPDSIISIGKYAFYGCTGLTSITIPDRVTSIGNSAFYGCSSLTSITIPDSLTTIGEYSFKGCYNLRSFFYSGTSEEWNSIEKGSLETDLSEFYVHFGVLAEDASNHLKSEITKEATCINFGEKTITCDCGYSYTVSIHSLGHNQGELVRTVDPTCTDWGYSVYRCDRCNEEYEANYTDSLGHQGELVKTVEPTCTKYGYSVYHCERCDEEYNDDYIEPIYHSFENDVCTRCGYAISDIMLGETKTVILKESERAYFKFTPETSGTYYFYSDSYYDTYGYMYDSNFKVISSNDDGGNGSNFYASYSMTAGTVYYLGARFYSSGNTGSFAVSITDDYSAETAHDFEQKVHELSCIYNEENVYTCKNCGYSYTVVKNESTGHNYVDGVCTKCGWLDDLEYSILDEEVTITGYSGDKSELVIPSNLCGYPVVKIGNYAFENCSSLTSVTIPDSVTSIGSSAFEGCSSLTSVTIPNSVTSIGSYAFEGCSSLTSVTIPNSVTSIGSSAFWGCTGLTSITIPDSVTSISNSAFYYCSSLTSVTIPDSVTSIGDWTFGYCSNLTSITIPDSVTSIGDWAFECCSSLTSVIIPDSVTSIGNFAFEGCYKLRSVFYSGTLEEWNSIEKGSLETDLSEFYVHFGVSAEDTHTHLKTDITKEATCDNEGEMNATCDCGYSYVVYIPELGHQKGDLVQKVDSTCINSGYSVYQCNRCDEEFYTDYVDSFGHNQGELVRTVEPTCTNWGYSVCRCDRCNEEYEANYTDSLGHQGELVKTVEPTCTKYGYSVYHCERCDEEYNDDYIEPIYHSFESDVCTRCGYAISDIMLGETKTVALKESERAYFKFIPETSGTYYFYSYGSRDTYGYLYDSNMNQLISDDDNGYYGNFKLSYEFEAGHTYYLVARFYSSSSSGDISVSISQSFSDFTKVPDSTTVIDSENKLIYGLASGLNRYNDIYNFIAVSDDYYVDFSSNSIGTGTVLSLYNNADDLTDEYTIIVFGDVNGDGWYDGQDAVTVSMIAGGMLTREQVGEAVWMAADCNHDGVIDRADVELLNQAGVLLSSVDQTKSSDELIETSAEYVEYLSLIDQQADADSDETPENNTEATEDNEDPTELSLWNIIVKYFIALIKKLASVIKVF